MSDIVAVIDSACEDSLTIEGGDSIVLVLSGPVNISTGVTSGYTHTQTVVNATWTINHNLGRNVAAVSVFNNAGQQVGCDVQLLSSNTCVLSFETAFIGFANII